MAIYECEKCLKGIDIDIEEDYVFINNQFFHYDCWEGIKKRK